MLPGQACRDFPFVYVGVGLARRGLISDGLIELLTGAYPYHLLGHAGVSTNRSAGNCRSGWITAIT